LIFLFQLGMHYISRQWDLLYLTKIYSYLSFNVIPFFPFYIHILSPDGFFLIFFFSAFLLIMMELLLSSSLFTVQNVF